MKTDDKIEIIEALFTIKLALNSYNNLLDNGHRSKDKDYDRLKLAFDGVDSISKIITTN